MNKVRPYKKAYDIMRNAGLRPTRQRLGLARLLFEGGNRHVTAEQLHDEATAAKQRISLATIAIGRLPAAPDGTEIERVDVIVRVRDE
jgi:Fur family iron response transcriptional regulator